jgi:hypothetical protein
VAISADTAGPIGLALRALDDADRQVIADQPRDTIGRFATEDGYEIPGLALCTVAS